MAKNVKQLVEHEPTKEHKQKQWLNHELLAYANSVNWTKSGAWEKGPMRQTRAQDAQIRDLVLQALQLLAHIHKAQIDNETA